MTPTFQGEIQFRRWSDSSTQGVQVTFALPDSDALEPLKGLEGKRFMAVLVQIGDDEQAVQPPQTKPGPLCVEACSYCVDPAFLEWRGGIDSTEAKAWILGVCDVSSRKDLDRHAPAADRFITNVRRPFMRWQRERRK